MLSQGGGAVSGRIVLFLVLLAALIVIALGSMLAGRYYYGSLAFARSSSNKCLVLPWLSDLVAT
jgi:hypothetical protein